MLPSNTRWMRLAVIVFAAAAIAAVMLFIALSGALVPRAGAQSDELCPEVTMISAEALYTLYLVERVGSGFRQLGLSNRDIGSSITLDNINAVLGFQIERSGVLTDEVTYKHRVDERHSSYIIVGYEDDTDNDYNDAVIRRETNCSPPDGNGNNDGNGNGTEDPTEEPTEEPTQPPATSTPVPDDDDDDDDDDPPVVRDPTEPPKPTAELTAVPTAVPTVAPTAVPTAVPTVAPTAVPTVAATAAPVPTQDSTPETAATESPETAAAQETETEPTATPTPTPTPAPAPTNTPTPTPTPEPTATPTPTLTPTPLPTPTTQPAPTTAAAAVATPSPTPETATVPERVRSTLVGAANTLRDRNTLIILLIIIGVSIVGVFTYLILRRRQ